MAHGISWRENQTPVSTRFDDPYYSIIDGFLECQHVFLAGNDLPERWAKTEHFAIAELGFGTGLNFLATWQAWQKASKADNAKLTFTSFELYPLEFAIMERALAAWPDLQNLAALLLKAWPREPLQDHFQFQHESITLELIIGDANREVANWPSCAHAWFLDGFSPAKNPELWNAQLMQAVFHKTAPGGTFSTYAAAGWVRAQLQDAGFQVERTQGFARKKHMSRGQRPA